MPVNTEILRNGEPLQLRWSMWHFQVMWEISEKEGTDIFSDIDHVVKQDWEIVDPTGVNDTLYLKEGDVMRMWR